MANRSTSQRKAIRRNAILLALLAVAFYGGFILAQYFRSHP